MKPKHYVTAYGGYFRSFKTALEAESHSRAVSRNKPAAVDFGVLIRSGCHYHDGESAALEPVDPIPQIREAFPAIARRLDALDELWSMVNDLSNYSTALDYHYLCLRIAAIIREAKR